MTIIEAIEMFKENNGEFLKKCKETNDVCAVNYEWSCFTDTLCKEGLITQKQYDTWLTPKFIVTNKEDKKVKTQLTIKYIGEDEWGRKRYEGVTLTTTTGKTLERIGYYYVDVDGTIYESYGVWGEPDWPLMNEKYDITRI